VRIKRTAYNGFEHEKVFKRFNCERFVGETTVCGEYWPVAFYHAPDFDASKGHKEYVLVQIKSPRGVGLVRGMTAEEAKPWLTGITGVWCLDCDVVIYSPYRHGAVECRCGDGESMFVDGGRDYERSGHNDDQKWRRVTIDLMNRRVRYKKTKKEKT
jgi:hypothetical protein